MTQTCLLQLNEQKKSVVFHRKNLLKTPSGRYAMKYIAQIANWIKEFNAISEINAIDEINEFSVLKAVFLKTFVRWIHKVKDDVYQSS